MQLIELTQGRVAIVDDDDYPMLIAYSWYFDNACSGYAGTTIGGRKNKQHIKMHRLIMNAPVGMEVDHINGNTLDNRKENLRLATRAENARNRRKATGKYLHKGIARDARGGNWTAQLQVDRNYFAVHGLANELVAAVAYDYLAKQHHGEFAGLNFTDEEFAILWERHKDEILNPKRRKGISKYVGVSYNVRQHCWFGQFQYKGKNHWTGNYQTEEEAHESREKALAEFMALQKAG